jgi:hypothetical protein
MLQFVSLERPRRETIMTIPKFKRVWDKTKHVHGSEFRDFIDSLDTSSFPLVIIEVVDNDVGFLEYLKVMPPDAVFFDGLVERFNTRIMIRPIISSNFMSCYIYLEECSA